MQDHDYEDYLYEQMQELAWEDEQAHMDSEDAAAQAELEDEEEESDEEYYRGTQH